MQNNITTLLLGIQDAQVTGVSEERSLITIDCKSVHDRVCPHCSSSHVWVHDHREQVLRDAAMRRKHVLLRVKKTLYDCKDCGARFEAPLSFVGMGKQMTKRFIAYAVDAFRAIPSISELAQEAGISSTRIFRIVPRQRLPRVFCIDEFSASNEWKGLVATMLERSEAIRTAYVLKEGFYTYVFSHKNKVSARATLSTWMEETKKSRLKEWRFCLRAYRNRFDEITNSFDFSWSNGYMEGTHNKIKTVSVWPLGCKTFIISERNCFSFVQ